MVNLRRMSHVRKPAAAPSPDPWKAQSIKRLVSSELARVLPTDEELGRLAEIRPPDVDRAEFLWNQAQRRAETGLEGLLSATSEVE